MIAKLKNKLVNTLFTAAMPLVRARNRREIDAFSSRGAEAKQLVELHREAKQAATGPRPPSIELIETDRKALQQRHEPLVDGDLGESVPWDAGLTVADACKASRAPTHAAYLYHLIRRIKPEKVLELGTNVGISGAYIAAALNENKNGRLVTMDASPYRQRVASGVFERTGVGEVDLVLGHFDDTFDATLREHGPFDFAFIDGNHKLEPTLHYARQISRLAKGPVWVLFDDIRWSDGMAEAWRVLQTDSCMIAGLDLNSISLCLMGSRESGQPIVSKPIYGAFR